jgi:hypothetical protein
LRAIGEAAARTATDAQFKTFAISEFLPTPATREIISSKALIAARRVGSQRGPRTRHQWHIWLQMRVEVKNVMEGVGDMDGRSWQTKTLDRGLKFHDCSLSQRR